MKDPMAITTCNKSVVDETLTIEKLMQTMLDFECSLMDREMEILLSDNGPATLSLIHGGELIRVNDRWYVVQRLPLLMSMIEKWRP